MQARPPDGDRGVVLFHRLGVRELRVILDALRAETVGGALLLLATVAALVLANTPARHAYYHLQHLELGPSALGLHLGLEEWAADGLLAIFFFVAGLELKRELVAGEMRHLSAALVPVVAAISGMVVSTLIYLLINLGQPTARGWAIPCATDIAFALAVLAVTGRFLPAALRAFLLTLAVVDDIGAIIVIAVAYSSSIKFPQLAASRGPARRLLAAPAPRVHLVVADDPAGRGDLGARARCRAARHGRRSGPRPAGAGHRRGRGRLAGRAP